MDAYRESLDSWQQEQKRQFQEFIIDEKELETRLKDTDDQDESKSRKPNSSLGVNQYKTVPPLIKNNLYTESNLSRIRKSREDRKNWKKPLPPNPFLLHLNVIARTNHMDQYLEFSKSVKNECEKYVDPLLGHLDKKKNSKKAKNDEEDSTSQINDQRSMCNEEEKEMMQTVLSCILR
jgi:hypothetical protein